VKTSVRVYAETSEQHKCFSWHLSPPHKGMLEISRRLAALKWWTV